MYTSHEFHTLTKPMYSPAFLCRLSFHICFRCCLIIMMLHIGLDAGLSDMKYERQYV
ncbi:hypothetical protein Hanom_Chr03g00213101 [Helianthus anomalus]